MTVLKTGGTVKTYGDNNLDTVLECAFVDLPIGFGYRVISKKLVLRMEFSSLDPCILVFTNVSKRRHPYIIKTMLDKLDQDEEEMNSDDEETDLELD